MKTTLQPLPPARALIRSSTAAGALIVCAAFLAGAGPQGVVFPGVTTESKSPDNRYTIRNRDDLKNTPAHSLTLVDNVDGVATTIYSYARHVDVLWSPASDAFVVNDHEGSDSSHPILFAPPRTRHPVDLRKKLIDYLRSRGRSKSVEGNGHVYFVVQRWLNNEEVVCEVNGYGDVDPKGFTKRYVYRLGDGFRPLE